MKTEDIDLTKLADALFVQGGNTKKPGYVFDYEHGEWVKKSYDEMIEWFSNKAKE